MKSCLDIRHQCENASMHLKEGIMELARMEQLGNEWHNHQDFSQFKRFLVKERGKMTI